MFQQRGSKEAEPETLFESGASTVHDWAVVNMQQESSADSRRHLGH